MLKNTTSKLKEARQQKYLDTCRQRLSDIAERKMSTTFIGALSSIENILGHLWGVNKTDSERTKQEQEYYELWQELRTEILNNGNNQCRALLNEISNHIISWKRYSATFYVGQRPEE